MPNFLREKVDGTQRLLLNIKRLNTYLEYKDFKTLTLQTILTLTQPYYYMATIDLKDTYYSLQIDGKTQAFSDFFVILKFKGLFTFPIGCFQVHQSLRS